MSTVVTAELLEIVACLYKSAPEIICRSRAMRCGRRSDWLCCQWTHAVCASSALVMYPWQRRTYNSQRSVSDVMWHHRSLHAVHASRTISAYHFTFNHHRLVILSLFNFRGFYDKNHFNTEKCRRKSLTFAAITCVLLCVVLRAAVQGSIQQRILPPKNSLKNRRLRWAG